MKIFLGIILVFLYLFPNISQSNTYDIINDRELILNYLKNSKCILDWPSLALHKYNNEICTSTSNTFSIIKNNDAEFRTYVFCIKLQSGEFLELPLKCNSIAEHSQLKNCSALISNNDGVDNSEQNDTIETETEFTCVKIGRFADLSDDNCKTYFLCLQYNNGTYFKQLNKCNGQAYFDPEHNVCSLVYECNNKPSLVEAEEEEIEGNDQGNENTSAIEQEEIPNDKEFICQEVGRFPDLSDKTCKSYFLCLRYWNGTFLKSAPTHCPGNSLFDPEKRVCSKVYKCISEVCNTIENSNTFACGNVGRFADVCDKDCKHYFLCLQYQNGTFLSQRLSCPDTSYFNSERGVCNFGFNCLKYI